MGCVGWLYSKRWQGPGWGHSVGCVMSMRALPRPSCALHGLWRTPLPNPYLRLLAAIFSLLITITPRSADAEPANPPQPKYGWQEVWAGADVTKDVWLLYSGITLAPFSEDMHANGLRLRAAGGYGQYHYTRKKLNAGSGLCGNPGQDSCTTPSSQRFNVDHTYAEALVGYHHRVGELTTKAFVGISSITHTLDREDRANSVSGDDLGVKGVVELWLNLGADGWTSLDLSYSTAHKTAAARSRIGWRAIPTVSIGPELRLDSNAYEDDEPTTTINDPANSIRIGAFARYEWFSGEVSLAGGYGGNTLRPETEELSSYGTINMMLRY